MSRRTPNPGPVESQPVRATSAASTGAAIEALRKSEERFSALANLSPDIISILNGAGELVFNSPAAFRIHGYTHEEMIGRSTFDFIHDEDRGIVSTTFEDLLGRPGGLGIVQYRYRHKDGGYTWMEATADNQLENPLIEGVIVISRDITQRKRDEEELRHALAVRDEFLSIASHELKTPLTVLKGHLDLMSWGLKSAPDNPSFSKLERGVTASLQQVNRMALLVKDLLDVTQIRLGKLALRKETGDLSELVRKTVADFGMLFEEAGCSLELILEPDVVGTWDLTRMEQVLENLISNAIKYAPGKPISIILAKRGELACLEVRDHGPGIDLLQQNKIFDRFERASAARNISGLGLGLFIAKQAVEAHGGILWLKSTPGDGACFVVELPLKVISTA